MTNNPKDDSNSIMIRLEQIENGGKVKINRDNITIYYEFSENTSSFAQSNTTYKRIITYDELVSLNSAIDLLKDKNNIIYQKYQSCFQRAKDIQKEIQELYSFGKTFVCENYYFFDLEDGKDSNIYRNLQNLNENYRLNILENAQTQSIKYPPFISVNNLLFFGTLLQRGETEKILIIVEQMFTHQIDQDIINDIKNLSNTQEQNDKYTNIQKQREKFICDPVKASIKLFSNLYEALAFKIKYPKSDGLAHEVLDYKFVYLQNQLQRHFVNQNFLVIRVNRTVETFHALPILSNLLYNDIQRIPYFFEYFFCFEDSNIESYFGDLENNQDNEADTSSRVSIQTKFAFIIHPELLSSKNQNLLREKIVSRMTPIPDMTLQKLIVITASDLFLYGNHPKDIQSDKVFEMGEASFRINASIMRKYIGRSRQFYFKFKIIQSSKAGEGKSALISELIDNEIEKARREGKEVRVFNHFIVDSNQRLPIESFANSDKKVKNIIHFQFSDEIMKKGIKFWSYLQQLYLYGFIFSADGEPISINQDQSFVFFEIPQLQRTNNNENDYPLRNLDEFPLPIPSSDPSSSEADYEYMNATKLENYDKSKTFNSSPDHSKYYKLGIDYVMNLIAPETPEKDLKTYMETICKEFFGKEEKFEASFRKLGYIEKFLNKYTKLYINSIPDTEERINNTRFTKFFYMLSISAFYAYDCLPKKEKYSSPEEKIKDKANKGLTFITVENLFDDHTPSTKKKIHFYTTKRKEEIFKGKIEYSNKDKFFEIEFSYSDSDLEIDNQTTKSPDILRNIFSSSEEYRDNVKKFKESHPSSFISLTQMTVPTLFRSSMILNRIFLSQPIILCGDTGCGKTSSLRLLFEYFQIPVNKQKYSLNVEVGKILNCHGGVTIDDVINHLKESPRSSKKHIIFFDELNTSPASSYIEHLLLNGDEKSYHCKFVFIGALNPWKQKNPISYYLTKVGLPQLIRNEDQELNLIEDINVKSSNQDMSEMMYHVHLPQKATEDIIFDFNPICYDAKDQIADILYPKEERDSVHSIVRSMSKYPNLKNKSKREKILKIFNDSIDTSVKFIRQLMKERAVISYRDIKRSILMYNFLYEYYSNKGDILKDLEIKETDIPIITSIISFVLRLPNHQTVTDDELKDHYEPFLKVFNDYFKDNKYGKYENKKFTIDIRDKLISLLQPDKDIKETKLMFMKYVYQYTLDYLKDAKIWKFRSTFIHLFIMDLCIRCRLPCFVIGMPGTSKSYAVELLESHNKKIYVSTYMSSRTSSPDGIKSQYYDAIYKEIENKSLERQGKLEGKSDDYMYVVFIDEMGNANINPSRPLKFLHGILDQGLVLNEMGYSKTVPTIGVSNYTMDFANMNRGVLVYTDLPDIDEILRVFELDTKTIDVDDVKSFIDSSSEMDLSNIRATFQNLWPKTKDREFSMPKTIALRSVYSIRFLIDQPKFDIHDVCRVLRELFNSKRLGETNNLFKDLFGQCPKNVKQFAEKKFKNIKVNNLLCFLERISDGDTKSRKSLCLFTQNYEILEYFSLFYEETKNNENCDFIGFLGKEYESKIQLQSNKFKQFKYFLFAENFKDKPEQISQSALENITECIKGKDEKIIFVGNHPCFDSCLDLLNVPHSAEQLKEREVTLGSGFSSKFTLTNLDFYIIMIANICDLQNIDKQENPFSYAFLDRTETVYIDWPMIALYYLRFRFPELGNENKAKEEFEKIQNTLKDHISYKLDEKQDMRLHSDIQDLYNHYSEVDFGNYYLNLLIKKRWESGIKAVILTKSKILEELYLPEKDSYSNKFDEEQFLVINDNNIQNFKELEDRINDIDSTNDENKYFERFIIIRCSTFNKLHFAHLKAFFDHISEKDTETIWNVFIVYFGLDPEVFKDLSSFKWPILSMEDISNHPELEVHMSNTQTDKMVDTLKSMNEDISLDNENENENENGICGQLFIKLFDIIITFKEKEISDKTQNKNLHIKENYVKSHFWDDNSCFDFVKTKIRDFGIVINENDLISSKKSQIISLVYKRLSNEIGPFLFFAFASEVTIKQYNKAYLSKYLMRCEYLDIPFQSYLNSNSGYDPFFYLFHDYIDFLINSNLSFTEDMLKMKCIADRVISIVSIADQITKIFQHIFDSKEYDQRISEFVHNLYKTCEFETISLQSYVDAHRFRSFAGLSFNDFEFDSYWYGYFISFVFQLIKNKEAKIQRNVQKISKSKIIDDIKAFRDKTIFEIFESPIEDDEDKSAKDKTNFCKRISSFMDLKIGDEKYQAFKEFMKDPRSLRDQCRFEFINNKIQLFDKILIESMIGYYALTNWDANDIKQFKVEFSDSSKNLEKPTIKSAKSFKNDLSDEKLKSFGRVYDDQYNDFKWDFIDDVNDLSFIDAIQSICTQNSSVKPKLRKFLLSGYEKDEPLSIIALRRYLRDQDENSKKILAQILDPFFANPTFIEHFIKEIKDQIFVNEKAFPFNDFTAVDDKIMDSVNFRTVSKFRNDNSNIYYFEVKNPSVAQFIWFHAAFCRPDKYPLITLLIRNSSFFIDFHPVPKIINALLHLRHIFSYNPVLIPIILHCTTLFKTNNRKFLFDLKCFEVEFNGNKVFENIDKELEALKAALEMNYKEKFNEISEKTSYEQIKFILSIYIKKYNEISNGINQLTQNLNSLPVYKVYSLLPNMLMNNLSIDEVFTFISYNDDIPAYKEAENHIRRIFATQCYKSYSEDSEIQNHEISLFEISYDEKDGRDFIGFTKNDYANLYNSIHIQDQTLSFEFREKEKDDIEHYHPKDTDNSNDLANCHMNTYNDDNFYNKSIFGENGGNLLQDQLLRNASKDFISDVRNMKKD